MYFLSIVCKGPLVCSAGGGGCPVTGNTVPLLLSDKQQHIVGQLSSGGGGRDQSSSPQVSLKFSSDLESCHLSAVGKSQICKRRIT